MKKQSKTANLEIYKRGIKTDEFQNKSQDGLLQRRDEIPRIDNKSNIGNVSNESQTNANQLK